MRTLSFNEEVHEYRVTDEETRLFEIPLSVTEIAARVTGKDLSAAPAEAVLAARFRGVSIHKDVELRRFATVEGQWIATQLDFTAFRSEVRGWAEVDGVVFAGTCDLVSHPDLEGIVEIDDIKSEAGEDRLYWTIQLALYAQCFASGSQTRHFVLAVPKTGNYAKVPIAALDESKVAEIIRAYKEGWILSDDFLSQTAQDAPEPTLDLVIYKQDLGVLTTNAKAILATVKAKCAAYKAENYSEENIADAKRDRADLNAAAASLDAKRLELERAFMRPFSEFKDTVSETVKEMKRASGLIDTVVKDVEKREKEEKLALIRSYFDGLKTNLATFDQIQRPEWLNKGTKIKDIHTEIASKLDRIRADLEVLDRIGETEARALYLSTLDLESALKKADELKANRERLAKIKAAQEEAERMIAEEKANSAPGVKIEAARATAPDWVQVSAERETEEEEVEEEEIEVPAVKSDPLFEREIRVRGTVADLQWLAAQMTERGIWFEKIVKELSA